MKENIMTNILIFVIIKRVIDTVAIRNGIGITVLGISEMISEN